jgi:hypothetical protein
MNEKQENRLAGFGNGRPLSGEGRTANEPAQMTGHAIDDPPPLAYHPA